MKLDTILEMITKERVVRNGNWITKFTSNKQGYKILNQKGQRKEVKINFMEMKKRKRSAKKAAKKRKGKQGQMNAKRKRSMSKRR